MPVLRRLQRRSSIISPPVGKLHDSLRLLRPEHPLRVHSDFLVRNTIGNSGLRFQLPVNRPPSTSAIVARLRHFQERLDNALRGARL